MLCTTTRCFAAASLFLSCAVSFGQTQLQESTVITESAAGDASAFYDAATGDIYVSLGAGLEFIVLYDAPFGFRDGVFDQNLVDGSSELGPPVTNSEQEIGWLVLDTTLPASVSNIGPLLPADFSILTNEDFDLIYPNATFEYGTRGAQSTVTRINVIRGFFAIPEPSSILVLCCSATMIGLRRRRNHVRCQTLD
jgi:hypothetical protein